MVHLLNTEAESRSKGQAGSLVPGHAGSGMADHRSRDVIW